MMKSICLCFASRDNRAVKLARIGKRLPMAEADGQYTDFRESDNQKILARWNSNADASNRKVSVIDYLTLKQLTVADDDDRDVLAGSSGMDWFFANFDGDGDRDKVTDLDDELFATDLDFVLS